MGKWSKDQEDNVAVARGRLRKLLPARVWHFHYKDDSGKWVSRSTGHRDKTGAVRWAESFSLQGFF